VSLNSLHLTARIAALQAMRYTPAGVPVLEMVLSHSSQAQELGGTREVNLSLSAVAFGAHAERLIKQAVGSEWRFEGFLADARRGKSVVFHIQEFLQD
jgi:primosomal replication protein N